MSRRFNARRVYACLLQSSNSKNDSFAVWITSPCFQFQHCHQNTKFKLINNRAGYITLTPFIDQLTKILLATKPRNTQFASKRMYTSDGNNKTIYLSTIRFERKNQNQCRQSHLKERIKINAAIPLWTQIRIPI